MAAKQIFRQRDQQFLDKLATATRQKLSDPDLSSEHIAAEIGVSVRLLQRQVKALLGVTFTLYLRNLRLSLARDLLRQGYTVKEVANQAGFRDPSYLGRVFKEKYNFTPTHYKKVEREKPP